MMQPLTDRAGTNALSAWTEIVVVHPPLHQALWLGHGKHDEAAPAADTLLPPEQETGQLARVSLVIHPAVPSAGRSRRVAACALAEWHSRTP
jgi:hypothetical protein